MAKTKRAPIRGLAPSGGRNPRYTKPSKRRGGGRKKSKKKILVSSKQVKKWNKASTDSKMDISTFYHHKRDSTQLICAENSSKFLNTTGVTKSNIEERLMALKKMNTNVAIAVPLTTDIVTNTEGQKIDCKIGTFARAVNNFATPVWCDIYCLVPKKDTSLSPTQAFNNGLDSITNGTDAVSNTSVHVYLSWSPDFRALWEIKSHKKVCLAPGESVTLGYSKKFKYEPNVTDHHTPAYQSKYGGHNYGIRVEGTLGHSETTSTNVGTGIAGVDLLIDTTLRVRYDAGLKTVSYEVENTSGAQTGGTVVGYPTNAKNTTFDADVS